MSIELAIEKAVERAFQQQLEPILAQFASKVKSKDLEEEFWDTDRASKHLGVASATMAFWRFEKRGPRFHRFGSSVRYKKSDLEEFVEANKDLLGKKGRPAKAAKIPTAVETNGSVHGRRKFQAKYLTGAPGAEGEVK